MFGDFKNLTYGVTKNKFRKLKDIFDRLSLENLNERLNHLTNIIDSLDSKVQTVKILVEERRQQLISPIKPPSPAFSPDLAIDSILATIFSNYVNIQVIIKNIGSFKSAATSLTTQMAEIFNQNDGIPSLEIGDYVERNIQIPFDPSGTIDPQTALFNAIPVPDEINIANNGGAALVEHFKAQYPPDGNTYIIIHAHNEEGKEIGGIVGSFYSPSFYIDNQYIFGTASILSQHAQRYNIAAPGFGFLPGWHTCKCVFNGITVTQAINFVENKTTSIIFTFLRTDMPINYSYKQSATINTFPYRPDYNDYFNITTTSPFRTAGYLIGSSGLIIVSYSLSTKSFIYTQNVSSPGHDAMVIADITNNAPISINIPSHLDFINWFSQSYMIGNYPSLAIYDGSSYTTIISGGDSTMPGIQFPANKTYSKLSFGIGAFETEANLGNGYNAIGILSGNLLGLGLKISSVPYDILGTSF